MSSALATAPAAAPVTMTGSEEIKAPMPGLALRFNVKVGDTVPANGLVCILEAMKMEIPVVAPQDGTVASIDVAVGDSVEAGAVLATLN